MCKCKCGCCANQGYSETSLRLATELKDKAIRNLEKTVEGRRRLAILRKEGKA